MYLLVCGQRSAPPAVTVNSPILCRSRGAKGERVRESRPLQASTETRLEKGKGSVSGICLGQLGSWGWLIQPPLLKTDSKEGLLLPDEATGVALLP